MPEPSHQFEHFVRAVHRRMVVLRAAERIGWCVLGGCVVLLMLVPLLLWRGAPSGLLVAATFGTFAVAGFAWAVVARPTTLAAAAEVDRQFRLSDLLSTACALRRGGAGSADDFRRVVFALADARCRGASPGAVVLHRLGARGWGGIGLAVALVAGLTLIGPDDQQRQARAAAVGPTSWRDADGPTVDDGGRAIGAPADPDTRRAKPGTGGDDRDPLNTAVPDTVTPPLRTETTPGERPPTDGGGGAANDGAGGGAGRGAANPITQMPPNVGTTSAGANTGTGATAGGGGTAVAGTGDGSGGTSSGTTGRRPAPPWQGDGWPAAREAAGTAVRSGAVPERYRELVREYFEK
jgi:hypothetical protein